MKIHLKIFSWFQKLWRKPSANGQAPIWPNSSPLSTARSTPAPTSSVPPKSEAKANEWRADERSERNIATLEPVTAKLAREHLRRLAAEGLNFKITSGTRTFAEQAKLFAQGRSAPGKIVTRAKPGSSWHNFGVAYDLTLFSGKNPVWESPKYLRAGEIGEELGLEWGHRWKSFRDTPHFQRPLSLTLAQARAKYANGLIA